MDRGVREFKRRIHKNVDQGPWDALGLSSVDLYQYMVQDILSNTLEPISDSLDYWDDLIDLGTYGTVLYGIQNVFTLREWKLKNIRAHIMEARTEVHRLRSSAAEEIGIMIQSAFKAGQNEDASVQQVLTETLASLSVSLSTSLPSSLPSIGGGDIKQLDSQLDLQSIDSARQLVDQLQARHLQQQSVYRDKLWLYGKPRVTTRYWPFLFIGALGAVKVFGNWQNIVHWFRNEILETAVSLWKNWILQPFYKIYQTIRHDENARVAIMAKKSLDADMKSLERMVVQFSKDTNNNSSRQQDIDIIVSKVQQGDLTDVLLPYEKEIQLPLYKSLLRGNLVRALLIQVQKTKVDVEVAMDGIDKMLQSQQLVFGLVAALPSIGLVWWLIRNFGQVVQGKSRQIRGKSQLLRKMSVALGEIEAILRSSEKHDQLSAESLGLLVCHTQRLRQYAKRAFANKDLYRQFSRRLDTIDDPQLTVEAHIKGLEWIYLVGLPSA